MKKQLVIGKIQDLQFIILSEFIEFKSIIITTFVLLKDASNKNLLTRSFK